MPNNVIDMFGWRPTDDKLRRECPHCRSVHNDDLDAVACRNAANERRVAAERARNNKSTLRSYRLRSKGDE